MNTQSTKMHTAEPRMTVHEFCADPHLRKLLCVIVKLQEVKKGAFKKQDVKFKGWSHANLILDEDEMWINVYFHVKKDGIYKVPVEYASINIPLFQETAALPKCRAELDHYLDAVQLLT